MSKTERKQIVKLYRKVYFNALGNDVPITKIKTMAGRLVCPYKRKGVKQAIKKYIQLLH